MQQCAIAVISNNRKCHATEIGIRSEVWRQMNGAPNFNGHPGHGTVEEDYEHDGANINLGTISKYIKRLSFFRLEAGPQKTRADIKDDSWLDITGNIPVLRSWDHASGYVQHDSCVAPWGVSRSFRAIHP